jgi:predicted phosphodiesterase
MKIALASDIHLEFGGLDLKNPGADVLVLAGDVCIAHDLKSYLKNRGLNIPTTFTFNKGSRFYDFFKACKENFEHVIYIAGNHEFYHNTHEETLETLYDLSSELNIHFLDNSFVEINGVRFLGGTLWTNMKNLDALTMLDCGEWMNDYKQIRLASQGYRKLKPKDTVEFHSKSLTWLRSQLQTVSKTVVVTHHAPSELSRHPRYHPDESTNWAYYSNLEGLVLDNTQVALWCHGHTHEPHDYVLGTTRIVCNPRGYVGYESRAEEFQLKVLEI